MINFIGGEEIEQGIMIQNMVHMVFANFETRDDRR